MRDTLRAEIERKLKLLAEYLNKRNLEGSKP